MKATRVLADRRQLRAFVADCVAVTAGVVLHLPMFWRGRNNGFRMAVMPMDVPILWGMALIVARLGASAYGLLPRRFRDGSPTVRAAAAELSITAPEVPA